MIAFVCWIASRMVASECQIVACDASTAMIKIDSKYFMVAPLHPVLRWKIAAGGIGSSQIVVRPLLGQIVTSPQGSLACVCIVAFRAVAPDSAPGFLEASTINPVSNIAPTTVLAQSQRRNAF